MDALDRARLATADIGRYVEAIEDLKGVRLGALREAAAAGASRTEMARALGVTLPRVNQLLGSQYARGEVVKGGEGSRRPVKAGKSRPKTAVKAPEPEPHRHRYVSEAWNHVRGGYLLRQRCSCGDTRVVPAPTIPKDLKGGPDETIVAA